MEIDKSQSQGEAKKWEPSDGAGRKAAAPQPERKGDLNIAVGGDGSNTFRIKNPG